MRAGSTRTERQRLADLFARPTGQQVLEHFALAFSQFGEACTRYDLRRKSAAPDFIVWNATRTSPCPASMILE